MMNIKKSLAMIAIAGATTAAVSATLSAAPASATTQFTKFHHVKKVECSNNRPDQVKITGHTDNDVKTEPFEMCLVRWGHVTAFDQTDSLPSVTRWTKTISTGNKYRFCVQDADGARYLLPKNFVWEPSKAFKMTSFRIIGPRQHAPNCSSYTKLK